MKVKVFKNFLSENEIMLLNDWTLQNKEKDFFKDANMGKIGTRVTTRYSDPDSFSFPEISYLIQKKIIKLLKIKDFIIPPFKDGIISGIGTEGGTIRPHKDQVWFPRTQTLHCNILTQSSLLGGNIFIENKEFLVKEGDMLCFIPSKQEHYVNKIIGNRERVIWIFGFCVPKEFIFFDDDILSSV